MDAVHPSQQNTPSRPAHLAVWGATDKGRRREGNEDAIFPHSGSDTFPFQPSPEQLRQKGQLLIVADGVGGAQGGREASHWAIRVAVERYYDMTGPDLGANLRTAVEMANSSLYQYIQSTGTREAGCTMAAAVIHNYTLYVANVGDSRVYLLRNGQIAQLTRDHTLTQQKIDQGIIRPQDAANDPGSHVLVRSMGAGQTVQVDLFPPLQLAPGDAVLLCSDGLTDMVQDLEIGRLIGTHAPRRGTQRLIAAANHNGGVDNISVIIARLDGKPPSPVSGGPLISLTQMTRQQQLVIAAGAILVPILLCAMLAWGYHWVQGRSQPTSTPLPSATSLLPPVATADVSPTAPLAETEQAIETTPSEQLATSTPVSYTHLTLPTKRIV